MDTCTTCQDFQQKFKPHSDFQSVTGDKALGLLGQWLSHRNTDHIIPAMQKATVRDVEHWLFGGSTGGL